jgi:phosphatidylserine/phosphatidylglycerophosphate/cardiolipin synthase-like enzyme
VLHAAVDPLATARALSLWIAEGTPIARQLQPDRQLAETARLVLDGLPRQDVEALCLAAGAWVLGYRSAPARPGWTPVISQPQRRMPAGINRSTGETVIALIDGAADRIAIASPFIDAEAIGILIAPLLAAAERGVSVTLITQQVEKVLAVRRLAGAFSERGLEARLRVHHALPTQPWPHIKLVLVDARVAYVGSANLTGNALMGRNLELGVLVEGDVSALGAVLDGFTAER